MIDMVIKIKRFLSDFSKDWHSTKLKNNHHNHWDSHCTQPTINQPTQKPTLQRSMGVAPNHLGEGAVRFLDFYFFLLTDPHVD